MGDRHHLRDSRLRAGPGESRRMARTRSDPTADRSACPATAERSTLYLATIAAAEAGAASPRNGSSEALARGGAVRAQGLGVALSLRVVGPSEATFAAPGGAIADLSVSPDGRLLAAAAADGTASLLDARSGATIGTLTGHTAAVWSPVFLRRPPARDRVVGRLDPRLGRRRRQPVADVSGQRAWRRGCRVAPGAHPTRRELVDRSSERGVWRTINVWDTENGLSVRRFEHGVKPIGSIAFNHDGSLHRRRDMGLRRRHLGDEELDRESQALAAEERGLQSGAGPDLSPDGTALPVFADGRARNRTWRAPKSNALSTPPLKGS